MGNNVLIRGVKIKIDICTFEDSFDSHIKGCNKSCLSLFAAIYYTMATIGPAAGYVIGGQLLLFYTDFMTTDPVT